MGGRDQAFDGRSRGYFTGGRDVVGSDKWGIYGQSGGLIVGAGAVNANTPGLGASASMNASTSALPTWAEVIMGPAGAKIVETIGPDKALEIAMGPLGSEVAAQGSEAIKQTASGIVGTLKVVAVGACILGALFVGSQVYEASQTRKAR